jgi:ATP-dependent protease HslVU (ClpYQ) peptidase subunit
MFNLFKSKKEKLKSKHKKMLQRAFELSKTDRKKSDQLYAEAESLMKEIESI